MAKNPLHDIAIVAVHNTKQARFLDENEDELLVGAIRAVLDEAGLKHTDIDGANIWGWTQPRSGVDAIDWLGGRASWNGMHLPGIASVMEAAGAILAGQCSTVLIASAQAGAHRERSRTAPWTRPEHEFSACWGMFTAAQFALIARRWPLAYVRGCATQAHLPLGRFATLQRRLFASIQAAVVVPVGRGPRSRRKLLVRCWSGNA
jgi:acetyl-CoA acetyltransferase